MAKTFTAVVYWSHNIQNIYVRKEKAIVHQADSDELFSDLSVRGFEALFEPAAQTNSVTYRADTTSKTSTGTASIDATKSNVLDNDTSATDNFRPLGNFGSINDFSPVSLNDYNPDVPYESGTQAWTLRVASEKLGLSLNTIRKRIRTGQLHADKVIGLNGPEWRIQPPDTTTTTGTNRTTVDTLLKLIETQARQLEIATSQLTASTEHVKAATRVIAYQQIQLEEKEGRVKLLTDSRHHKWWPMKILRRLMRA